MSKIKSNQNDYVDISFLPTKNQVDWNNCIGIKLVYSTKFTSSVVEIISCDNYAVTIKKEDNSILVLNRSTFLKCIDITKLVYKKGIIDWNQINETKPFVYYSYNGCVGKLQIVDSVCIKNKRYVIAKDECGREYKLRFDSLVNCNLQNIILQNPNYMNCHGYKYKCGDVITTRTGKIEIIEQTRIQYKQSSSKAYKYRCLIDGFESEKVESSILNGVGCPVCSNQVVIKGINDLWTTEPSIANMLKDKNLGYTVSRGSGRIASFICPNCNTEKRKRIDSAVLDGLQCICSDNIPTPEKFMFAILTNLGYNFEYHKRFIWANHIEYDFFISDKNTIVETHGPQHFLDTSSDFSYLGGRSSLEEKKNDEIKKDTALKNGIKYYISVDCRYSRFDYLKDSVICNKTFSSLLDVTSINWDYVKSFCASNIKKFAINLYNSGKSFSEISSKLSLAEGTIRQYIIDGDSIGACTYKFERDIKAEKLQATITEYALQGFSKSEISKNLNISDETVSKYLKKANIQTINYKTKLKQQRINKLMELYNKDTSISTIAKELGVTQTTIYNYLKEIKKQS